jgi:CRP-like cAMP-binding protein
MAYLYNRDEPRSATVVTLQPCRFLEISRSALSLASEELQERMSDMLISRIVRRLRQANLRLIENSEPATKGRNAGVVTQKTADGKPLLELMP